MYYNKLRKDWKTLSILDDERRNKNIEKENERFTIETHIFNEKYINKAGNISDETYQKKICGIR